MLPFGSCISVKILSSVNGCQRIDQSIAQPNYFIHLRYFFCKDIAYFKISYYFCSAFEKKQHSSLAQSVRASDC